MKEFTTTITQNCTILPIVEQDIVIPPDQKLTLSCTGDAAFGLYDSISIIIPFEYNRLILATAVATTTIVGGENSTHVGFSITVNSTEIAREESVGVAATIKEIVCQVTPGKTYVCTIHAFGRGGMTAIAEFKFGKDQTPDFIV